MNRTSGTANPERLDNRSPAKLEAMVSDEPGWNCNIHYHRVIFDAIPPGCRTALDVGSGDGLLTRQLHRRGVPQVTGIDLHEPSIEAARTHPDADGITYIVDGRQEGNRTVGGTAAFLISGC